MKMIINLISKVILPPIIAFVFIITSMRALISPTYINLAYKFPNIPPDPYGFTNSQRLIWANLSVSFLISDIDKVDLEFLEYKRRRALFTGKEVSHLIDVKRVINTVTNLWLLSILLIILFGIGLHRIGEERIFVSSLSWGSWLTIGLLLTIEIMTTIDFGAFFSGFHSLFFLGDSWLFPENSMLIRLFPIEFWQNSLNAIGFISLALCLITLFFTMHKKSHNYNT